MNNKMDNTNLVEPITLEQVRMLRQQKLEEIRDKQQSILAISKKMVAPVTEVAHRGNALSKSFGIGMTAIQGIMMGLRVMRNFRGLFHKKRRY